MRMLLPEPWKDTISKENKKRIFLTENRNNPYVFCGGVLMTFSLRRVTRLDIIRNKVILCRMGVVVSMNGRIGQRR